MNGRAIFNFIYMVVVGTKDYTVSSVCVVLYKEQQNIMTDPYSEKLDDQRFNSQDAQLTSVLVFGQLSC